MHGRKKQKRAQASRQMEKHASLPWKAAPLPLEAVAGGGQSDADFFQGLNFDDDDYMGIREVEGVDVVKGEDGNVQFVVEDKTDSRSTAKPTKKAPVERIEQAQNVGGELPDVMFSDEEEIEGTEEVEEAISEKEFVGSDGEDDVDEEREGESEGEGVDDGDDHTADFRVLMGEADASKTEVTWSKKAMGE